MRRWWLELVTFLVVVAAGVGALWAIGQNPRDWFTFESSSRTTLEPLQFDEPPVTTVAPATTVTTTTDAADAVDPAHVMICVHHTKTFAFLEDTDAVALWRFAGETDAQLSDVCEQLLVDDPGAVDVWRWELAALPADGP